MVFLTCGCYILLLTFMLITVLTFLKRIYLESCLGLEQKSEIVWTHGQYVGSVQSNNGYLLIYALDKPLKRSFAVLHIRNKSHEIVKIEFLPQLGVAKYISSKILEPLIPSFIQE
jgi:hypothetical protein